MKAAAKGSKDKPGGQLKSDLKKPIVALAANHTERQSLLLLYADGALACSVCSPSTRTMSTRWILSPDAPRSQITEVVSLIIHNIREVPQSSWYCSLLTYLLLLTMQLHADALGTAEVAKSDMQGALHAVPHPEVSGGALIAVGTGSGTVAAYESVGSAEPSLIGQSSTAGFVQSVSISLAPSRVSLLLILISARTWKEAKAVSPLECVFHIALCLQVLAAVQDIQGELHLVAWSILFGPDKATWLHEKVVPDRLNEACSSATSTGSLTLGSTEVQKSSTSWQVKWHEQYFRAQSREALCAHTDDKALVKLNTLMTAGVVDGGVLLCSGQRGPGVAGRAPAYAPKPGSGSRAAYRDRALGQRAERAHRSIVACRC